MRGHNEVWISGNIGGKIVKSQTRDGRSACSFAVASEGEKHRLTWVRVNVYDRLADYCKEVLDKGLYCSVVGELMNRDGQHGELTEVRARNIIFLRPNQSLNDDGEASTEEDEYDDDVKNTDGDE
jgi:single-stranded DNA-binding protein